MLFAVITTILSATLAEVIVRGTIALVLGLLALVISCSASLPRATTSSKIERPNQQSILEVRREKSRHIASAGRLLAGGVIVGALIAVAISISIASAVSRILGSLI